MALFTRDYEHIKASTRGSKGNHRRQNAWLCSFPLTLLEHWELWLAGVSIEFF